MWLNRNVFHTVVAHAPLVSIDLVVQAADGGILLGRRLNRPAAHYWFVPGGRVRKGESLDDAFQRITSEELGYFTSRSKSTFLGVFEHFYDDSAFDDTDACCTTHYVVLAHHVKINSVDMLNLPDNVQHSKFLWWDPEVMASHPRVHENSKAYLAALAALSRGNEA